MDLEFGGVAITESSLVACPEKIGLVSARPYSSLAIMM